MWREGRVGPGCEFASSSMTPEPILAPLIMGRRPKHVCHYPSLGVIRYNKLEKVTDVRYGYPLFPPNDSLIQILTLARTSSC